MEKHQVTFAVTARGVTGQLGRPILVVCEAAEGDARQLVTLQAAHGDLWEVRRSQRHTVPVHASVADVLSAMSGDSLYNWICANWGIQLAMEVPPPG